MTSESDQQTATGDGRPITILIEFHECLKRLQTFTERHEISHIQFGKWTATLMSNKHNGEDCTCFEESRESEEIEEEDEKRPINGPLYELKVHVRS